MRLDQELFFLAAAALSITGILSVILVYLVIRKGLEISARRKVEDWKQKLNLPLFSFLYEGKQLEEAALADRASLLAAEELLGHYADILEGEQERKNLSFFAESYLSGHYAKGLQSRRWSTRINSLYHIEDFHLKSLEREVLRIAESGESTSSEKVQAFKILADFQSEKLSVLLESSSLPFSEFDLRNILMRLDGKVFDWFVESFRTSPERLQLAVLDVIAVNKQLGYLHFVEEVFMSEAEEMRLRALKALASIGYTENIAPYEELADSSSWQERMLAAKLFGSIKDEGLLPRLAEMLHDPSWHVRSQAGQSILAFSKGKEVLQKVIDDSHDPYARDMAWEWMQKGELR
jgi:HEAT repeats